MEPLNECYDGADYDASDHGEVLELSEFATDLTRRIHAERARQAGFADG